MDERRHHYWVELNRYVTEAMHELFFIPFCCARCFASGFAKRKEIRQARHRLMKIKCQHCDAQVETVGNDGVIVQAKEALIHKPCHDDVIVRVHSGEALKYAQGSTNCFHNWMSNDCDHMDPYQALPHPSGFEQNVSGFNDEHLQRVEQYWIEHQLRNPSCPQKKSSALATAADWERTKLEAEEAGHKMAENV